MGYFRAVDNRPAQQARVRVQLRTSALKSLTASSYAGETGVCSCSQTASVQLAPGSALLEPSAMLRQATATDSADALAGAAWSPARDWLNTRACRLLCSSSHTLASGAIAHTHWPHSAAPHEGPCLKDSDWSTAPARAAASASWTPGGDTMADALLPSCDSTAAPSAFALVYTPMSA